MDDTTCSNRIRKQLIDKDYLTSRLPTIGMGLYKKSYLDRKRHNCVVTYVNSKNLWYEVEFEDTSGFTWKECFKLPENTPRYAS